jgi:hypothetical protein
MKPGLGKAAEWWQGAVLINLRNFVKNSQENGGEGEQKVR